MLQIRFRTHTMIFAIAAFAVLAAFLRPDARNDPPFLVVTYCTLIVGTLVQLLIYAISLVDFSWPIPKDGQSSGPDDGVGPKRGGGGSVG
jgi:hypothetical protein